MRSADRDGDRPFSCPNDECWCAYATGQTSEWFSERLRHHLCRCRSCFTRLAGLISALSMGEAFRRATSALRQEGEGYRVRRDPVVR